MRHDRQPSTDPVDVAVVGGGVVGLAVAYRAAARGLTVAVVDDARRGRASAVAAGMLAPVTEAEATEPEALRRGLAASAAWPAFAAEVQAASGLDVGLRTEGTLEVAHDAGDRSALERLAALLGRWGQPGELLTGRQARALEPLLDPGVRGGLLVPGDHSVDPRRLTAALAAAARRHGASVRRAEVRSVDDGGVRLVDDAEVRATTTVVAAGSWTSRLVPDAPVRPLKGQVLRLRGPAGLLPGRTVRGLVAGSAVYLVPRRDGELVVGATQEERADAEVTAGAVWQLLRDARALLPAVAELSFVEAAAGLRPATPGNAPLVHRLSPGLVVASGHGRNGVLLAPTTAEEVVDLLAAVPA